MSGKHYSWKRFWVPFGKEVPYNFDGFLYDPEEKWGNIYARDLTTLDKLGDSPALFLLGESGMGKTTVLEEEKQRLLGKGGTGPSPRVIYKNSGHRNKNFLSIELALFALQYFLFA